MARIHILREVSERGLDPKVPYVKGKDGKLLPNKKIKTTEVFKSAESTSLTSETLDSEVNSVEENASTVAVEENTTATEETKPKKKFPPPKKKKTVTVEENS